MHSLGIFNWQEHQLSNMDQKHNLQGQTLIFYSNEVTHVFLSVFQFPVDVLCCSQLLQNDKMSG